MERTIEIATVSIGAGLMSATRVGRGTVLSPAATNATVSLWPDNGSFASTYRRNDFFRGELNVNNSTGSLWLTITNVGVLRNGGNTDIVTNIIGSAFVPQTAETFDYDPDGNMTNDGRWSITWDGENRVTSFARRSGIAGPNTSVQCVSDYMGRRISKSVTSGASITHKYVYDGWNLIAILGLDGSLLYSFKLGSRWQRDHARCRRSRRAYFNDSAFRRQRRHIFLLLRRQFQCTITITWSFACDECCQEIQHLNATFDWQYEYTVEPK